MLEGFKVLMYHKVVTHDNGTGAPKPAKFVGIL
jgi:hypothetical protein